MFWDTSGARWHTRTELVIFLRYNRSAWSLLLWGSDGRPPLYIHGKLVKTRFARALGVESFEVHFPQEIPPRKWGFFQEDSSHARCSDAVIHILKKKIQEREKNLHSGSLDACFHNPWHEPRGRVLTPMRNLNFNYLLGDFFLWYINCFLSSPPMLPVFPLS